MGKPTGFLEIERRDRVYDPPKQRLKTWKEFTQPLAEPELRAQASRCMSSGLFLAQGMRHDLAHIRRQVGGSLCDEFDEACGEEVHKGYVFMMPWKGGAGSSDESRPSVSATSTFSRC